MCHSAQDYTQSTTRVEIRECVLHLVKIWLRMLFCIIYVIFNISVSRYLGKGDGVWRSYLARVVTRSPLFSRSVPLLRSLHWLPVLYRIIFKMCTIAYQALSYTQPAYLNSMLTPARNSRQLRSTNSNPLYIPRVKMKTGIRAFSVAAPTCGIRFLPVLNQNVI